jgi:hypothetical protein
MNNHVKSLMPSVWLYDAIISRDFPRKVGMNQSFADNMMATSGLPIPM